MTAFINSFQSEWLKKKRSLAAWLVIVGALFTPLIIIVARIIHYKKLPGIYSAPHFWESLWTSSWESMAIFLLPMGIILAMSLITQLEFKNNAWKQLHTTPQSFTQIYFTKLSVVLVMMVQFFFLFNFGVYLAGVIPYLLIDIPFPKDPVPYRTFLTDDLLYFTDCLPIIALQYLISIRFKNFLVSIGAGFLLWVVGLSSLSWEYGYAVPYTYPMYHYLKNVGKYTLDTPFHYYAAAYFIIFTAAGYLLYIFQKEKG